MASNPVRASPATALPDVAAAAPSDERLTALRWALMAFYVGFAATVFSIQGVPFDREQIIAWTFGGLAVICVGRPPWEIVRLARDWLPFALLLVAYDYTRGAADTLGLPVHRDAMINVDRVLGFGEIPTVWLQEKLLGDPVRWYDVLTTLVYVSHFVVVYLIAGVLWARDRKRWSAFIRRFLALTAAGLATYVLYPAVPPWMASRDGVIDDVSRISGKGWSALGIGRAGSMLQHGQGVVNQVAAMPSLHAAFAALIGAFFWRDARWPLRVLLVTYPLAMGFALVYSAEHYVTDVIAGWIYVAAVMAGMSWAENRWRNRHARPLVAPRASRGAP